MVLAAWHRGTEPLSQMVAPSTPLQAGLLSATGSAFTALGTHPGLADATGQPFPWVGPPSPQNDSQALFGGKPKREVPSQHRQL